MNINITDKVSEYAARAIKSKALIAILLVATFALVAERPAQAQNGDTWKSIAIIGGSTAAGAIIGHKVAGKTGMAVGAAAGAGVGYAIDRHRRNNEYNNGYYNSDYYPSNGPYGNYPYASNNSGYYGNQPVYNGGYQGGYNARYSRHR